MTDRELLEKAAKALGWRWSIADLVWYDDFAGTFIKSWNPLTDDGDAFRLMVKLDIDLMGSTNDADRTGQSVTFPVAGDWDSLTVWYQGGDKLAATRRAIVRAAAAIGDAA